MSDRLHLLFKRLAACAAVLFMLLYVAMAISRLSYPYHLEWLEGGCVDMVRQVLSPEPLYVPPSMHYMPFVYAPLYFYISAPISQLLGVGFTPLRLVSFLASLGCFAFIFAIARMETGKSYAGIVAAGLFAATYMLCGGWFDLARVDSLFLMLLLASVFVLRKGAGIRLALGAAVLLWLCLLTKQIALAIAIPLAIYAVVADRRNGLIFVGTFLGLAVASTFSLDAIYDGWYSYYVFELPMQHASVRDAILGFWITDIMAPLFVALVVSVLLIIYTWRSGARTTTLFYIAVAAGAVGGSWISRLHMGGYNNVLMPACAALAVLFGIGVIRIPQLAESRHWLTASRLGTIVLALALLQFAGLAYDPHWQIPSAEQRAASAELVQFVEEVEGEVFAPAYGYLPGRVGKQTYAHTAAIWDILRGDDTVARARLIGEFRSMIVQQEFEAVIVEGSHWFLPELPMYYTYRQTLALPFESEVLLWPRIQKMIRYENIYVPMPANRNQETEHPVPIN